MEREVLKLMPPGTLDLLATSECDVDAIERTETDIDPSNSDNMVITTYYKENTRRSEYMEGFTSSQL